MQKTLIAVMALGNLNQLIYWEFHSWKSGVYIKNIVLIFILSNAVFFYFFVLLYLKWLIVNIVQTTISLEKLVLEQ